MSKDIFTSIEGTSFAIILKDYVDNFLRKIGLDLSFQSIQRWKLEQAMAFINSCLLDMNINKFILVDCESCRARFPEGSDDYNYFDGWIKKGHRYLNVDSNNRNVTLLAFLSDLIQIMPGRYVIDEIVYTVKKGLTDVYSTMDEDLKIKLLGSKISLYMITYSTRKQLSDVFERMNSGLPLNFFEKINCTYSDTCRIIRDLAKKHADKLIETDMFSLSDKNRRVIDGFLAHVFYLIVHGVNVTFTHTTHAKWYNDKSADGVVGKFVKDFNRYMKLVGDNSKNIRHKFVFFDLFWLINEQEKQNKVLLKDKNIVQDFVDVYTKLANEKDKDKKSVMYTFYDKNGKAIEEHGTFPFKHFGKGEGTMTPTRHYLYRLKGFKIEDYFSNPLDSKRTVDRLEKQAIAVASNWTDADGDKIIPEELHDGNYHAGHIVAYAKGGRTEPSNMVIEKESSNLKHGTEETVIKS